MHRIAAHLHGGRWCSCTWCACSSPAPTRTASGRGQRREWNWVIGVVMLLLTLFLSFTGYLLPWDQLAFWAVTVGTNIASSIPLVGPSRCASCCIGGRTIEQATLIRFYVLHVIVLPGAAGRALRVPHVARAQGRRAGAQRTARRCSPRPRGGAADADQDLHPAGRRARHGARRSARARSRRPRPTVNAVPDLVRRAAIVTLGTFAVVGILVGVHRLAARGAGQRAGHAEPGEGALVLPVAAGDRHRHDDPHRVVHHQRRVRRRRDPARPADRPADRLAVARPQPARRRRACGSRTSRRTQNIVFLARRAWR